MALLPIIIAPDPRLKVTAKPVKNVDESVRRLMDDMLETMHAANGIGLAAPQVGELVRVLVVDAAKGDDERRPLRMANAEILWASDDDFTYEEGCLSFPDHYSDVTRAKTVRVAYIDEHNIRQEIEADELLATCIQHEIDHLEGVLFVDLISKLKRDLILRKLKKAQRQNAVVGA